MKKATIGPCPCCGKNIWKFWYLFKITKEGINIFFKRRPYALKDNGRHFWVLETTGSRMMIAICKKCFDTLTDDKVRAIYAKIIYGKLIGLKNIKNEDRKSKLFDHIRTTEVWKWAGEEKEIVQILNANKNG